MNGRGGTGADAPHRTGRREAAGALATVAVAGAASAVPSAAVAMAPAPGAAGRSVLEGAFGLLEAVERAGEAGPTRLAAECGLPKSTAHRLLEQLAELGAVERHGGNYRMGPQMFRLGHRWQPYPGLRSVAPQPMRGLAELTGAGVGICVLWKGQTLVLEWVSGTGAGQPVVCRPGTIWPWRSAPGKVLMAAAGPAALPGPPDPSWAREAAGIRARGAAFDREELVPGVCCAAVPLRGQPGRAPLASLCAVTDPAHHLERIAQAAARTAQVISTRLRGR
ncbi:helix-turn-helix domain-containing protein [Streptomyces sp. NPDC008092]|uniref:IclR family transcriptional regulator n=1 Tax=Streptomyces sp. NPDC008092 TaxID=3364808 RepID=UPI0036E6993D